MKTEIRALASIIPYARNPRKNLKAIDKVAASLKEFGWQQPMVVDVEGVLIVGHTRREGALQLGWTEGPVVVADQLTPAQVKAYRLADNRTSEEAEWDSDLLALEFLDLRALDYDLALTAFDDNELLLDVSESALPDLTSGEKEPFQQMTFTFHDDQADQVRRAMDVAKKMGEFTDSPNENGNGNALARVCEMFLTNHANS